MFWLLHLAAIIWFIPALFLTIPLHIIAGLIEDNKEPWKKQ